MCPLSIGTMDVNISSKINRKRRVLRELGSKCIVQKNGHFMRGKWILSLENFRDLMQSDLYRVRFLIVLSLLIISSLKWLKFWHDLLVEKCFRYRLVLWMLILVVR